MEKCDADIFGNLYENIIDKLESINALDTIYSELSMMKSDFDRVRLIIENSDVSNIIQIPDVFQGKSCSLSSNLRNKGNKLFQSEKYLEALHLYNESLLYAPVKSNSSNFCSDCLSQINKGVYVRDVRCSETDSDEYALILSNRSAALYYLEMYELSLKDSELALCHDYPEKFFFKLYERNAKCYKMMGQIKDASNMFHNAIEHINEISVLSDKQKSTWLNHIKRQLNDCVLDNIDGHLNVNEVNSNIDKSCPLLDKSNSIFTSLSECCDVTYSSDRGRFITAKTLIEPGEIILVEKPYASIVVPEKHKSNCHHCFSSIITSVACDFCSLVTYCSNDCKSESWLKYHNFECKCLKILYLSGLNKFGLLSFRTISQSSIKALINFKFIEERTSIDNYIMEGSNESGIYEATNYSTILSLVTNDNLRSPKDIFKRAIQAVFLAKTLQKHDYFQSIEAEIDNKKSFEFISGLLLKHLQSYPCNAHEISELDLNCNSVVQSSSQEIGAGIYSTLSLFNHSCDPKVVRFFHGDVCIVRAINIIKPGEEVSDNYGAVYPVHNVQEREEKLLPQYFFKCNCHACENDWPLYTKLLGENPVWFCEICCVELAVKDSYYTCPICLLCDETKTKESSLEEFQKITQSAFEKVLECNPQCALPLLYSSLKFYVTNFRQPWVGINNCQEMIKQCYSILGNCSKNLRHSYDKEKDL